MADGTFAALLLVFGLGDMALNHCGSESGCLGRTQVEPRAAISTGPVLFQEEPVGSEIYLRRDTSHRFGPFGTSFGVSVTDEGSIWFGAGWTRVWHFPGNAYVELHTMPGLYLQGSGVDLGGPIEFRSGIEIGLEANNQWRYSISYDHRSNAELYDRNPGLETVQIRVSVPTR